MNFFTEHDAAAKSAPVSSRQDRTYADEIMYASWNPAVLDIARESLRAGRGTMLRDKLAAADANAFMARVYAHASLI